MSNLDITPEMIASFEARKAGYRELSKQEREVGKLEVEQFIKDPTAKLEPIKRELKPPPNFKKLEQERVAKLQAIHGLPLEAKRAAFNKMADIIAASENRGGWFQVTNENEFICNALFLHALIRNPIKGILITGNTGTGKTMLLNIYLNYFNDYWRGELCTTRIRAKKYLEEKGKGSALSLDVKKNISRFWVEDLGSEDYLKVYGNEITLDGLLDKLYDDFKLRGQVPMICTNLEFEEIKDRYGERNISRLCHMVDFYTLEGDDFRRAEL